LMILAAGSPQGGVVSLYRKHQPSESTDSSGGAFLRAVPGSRGTVPARPVLVARPSEGEQ